MITQETLKLYRSQLPHGTGQVIAQKAGVSRQAVSAFFAGKSYSRQIEFAVLDTIAELTKERNVKLKAAGLL